MNEEIPIIPPKIIKSCSKCRSRKVKCDMTFPTCNRCERRDEICDICDMILYDYSTVRNLQLLIKDLQKKVTKTGCGEKKGENCNKHAHSHASLNKLVENSSSVEVGTLSSTNRNYTGTASGAIFTNIFLAQLNIPNLNSTNEFDKLNSNVSNLDIIDIPIVSLPGKTTTIYLLGIYIEYIHIFYPIININYIIKLIENIYNKSGNTTYNDRYMIFMILSISSQFAESKKEYINLHDLNNSMEYFYMAYKYLTHSISRINLDSIRNILLLVIWCLSLKNLEQNENLWVLTRHVTSLCIQLGLHRNNPNWRLNSIELEIRNRLWWTCYILERLVALQTGRTLSIRNYAIDAEMPKVRNAYDLIKSEYSLCCPSYKQFYFQPMYLLAKVRTIGGDILESVYIARGKRKTLAVESVCKSATRLREELDLWLESIMDLYIREDKWIYETLKLNYDIYSLALSRPSPSFPEVSTSSSKVCLNDSKSFIDIVNNQISSDSVMDFWFISANIITVGVTFLFSSWVLDADFVTTKKYIEKIHTIIKYLTKNSSQELPNIEIFLTVGNFTLEHLNASKDENQSTTNDIFSVKNSLQIEDDEDRKKFILNYLINIRDDGPFYLVQENT